MKTHVSETVSSCLVVCLQDYTKTTQAIFQKFHGMVAHEPRKKPLDFDGNPDVRYVRVGLGQD